MLEFQILDGIWHTDAKTNQYFQSLNMSSKEWESVSTVNKLLEVSQFWLSIHSHITEFDLVWIFEGATKWMEGDFNSGCQLLSEYQEFVKEVQSVNKLTASASNQTMASKMLECLNDYAKEAAGTKVVLVATFLNLCHWMLYIKKFYPDYQNEAKEAIDRIFNNYISKVPKPALKEYFKVSSQNDMDDEDYQFPAHPGTDTTHNQDWGKVIYSNILMVFTQVPKESIQSTDGKLVILSCDSFCECPLIIGLV